MPLGDIEGKSDGGEETVYTCLGNACKLNEYGLKGVIDYQKLSLKSCNIR